MLTTVVLLGIRDQIIILTPGHYIVNEGNYLFLGEYSSHIYLIRQFKNTLLTFPPVDHLPQLLVPHLMRSRGSKRILFQLAAR